MFNRTDGEMMDRKMARENIANLFGIIEHDLFTLNQILENLNVNQSMMASLIKPFLSSSAPIEEKK